MAALFFWRFPEKLFCLSADAQKGEQAHVRIV